MAAELPGDGPPVLPADLAEPGAAEKLAAEAGDGRRARRQRRAAGRGLATDFSPRRSTRALRVNLEAPMLIARALYPGMVERGSGHLVFVSSLSGKAASPRSSIYNATKFGLRGFALGLRTDLGRRESGFRLSPPASSATPGCSPTPVPSRPPGLGTGRPEEVGGRWSSRSSATSSRSPWRRCQHRFLTHFGLDRAPVISDRVQRGSMGQKAAQAIVDGHETNAPQKR